MANPFYLDKGFSLTDIANVTKIFGIIMTLIGATLGGILVIKYSTLKLMLVGAILVAITNVLFAVLAVSDANLLSLTILICLDNLSGGFATSIFIAYLSGMTNTTYTATQYALFSSLMTLPGKFIGGFSGMVVDSAGYPIFFIYSGLLGIPAIFVILFLIHSEQRIDAAPPSSANKVDS
jgi:PAT family beta-lactamase induction signal transducer AmpG